MVKAKVAYRCRECGAAVPKWVGRCPDCAAWGAVDEEWAAGPVGGGPHVAGRVPSGGSAWGTPVAMAGGDPGGWAPWPSGIVEVDRVLAGGLLPGSVTLLGGEPGIGKSTLVLQLVAGLAAGGRRCLVVSAEESPRQVRSRAERLGAVHDGIHLLCGSSLAAIEAAVATVAPDVCVVDSIQTVADPDAGGLPGSVGQVRECAQRMAGWAKARDMAAVLVGHVTKSGDLAGPRVLEHLVDTVVSFEGDRHHALRLLRVAKHRFGPTHELGVLEMAGDGLVPVPDPSGLFLADRLPGVPGSVVTPLVESGRPLLVEVQALTVDSPAPLPRRSGQGFDGGRLAMLLAVLERRAGMGLRGTDAYVSVVGGIRVTEPAADLAVALALAGGHTGVAVDQGTVVLGEVGLAGEVRQVPQVARRLTEASRMGFSRAIVPAGTPPGDGIRLLRVTRLSEAMAAAGVT